MTAPNAQSVLRSRLLGLGSGQTVAVGTLLIIVWVVYRVSIDLNPASLWLDDAWVVALSKAPDFGISLVQPASAPPLFMLIVGFASRLAPDLELGAQLWPFLCGLVAVALTSLLAYRITASGVCAVLSAGILVSEVFFLAHVARVKPYTGDVMVVLLLGLCFHSLLEGYTRRKLWIYASVVAGGCALSSLSILVAAAGSAVAWIALWRRGIRDRHLVYAGIVVGGAAACATAHVATRGYIQILVDQYTQNYLPTDDLPGLARAVFALFSDWVGRLAHVGTPGARAASPATWGAGVMVLLGGIQLWWSGRREHLFAGGSVLLVSLLACAAGRIPLGTGRVDLFLLPFGAILLGSAAGLLTRLPRPLVTPASAVLLAAAALLLWSPRVASYPPTLSAPLVEILVDEFRHSDELWVNHHGTYSLAAYAPWSFRFVRNPDFAIPYAAPAIENFTVLDSTGRGVDSLSPASDRLFVFLCHYRHGLRRRLLRLFKNSGYETLHFERTPACMLGLYRIRRETS